ncbi:hypothetical protein HYH03_004829 [Edaphochlamys debaryana]|uniref:N-acetyltransferase domain-containing protein n=1 Tax=Edaphochlamys debaryana TaxID=47281 RepID=A0A835Y923_9CHLO|nr:hypothetical protein HYH03_004829 [Edaphochlamys debaryana]|eukprot:KAG2497242.1 hypothetical protein HYH03_004829 [Edaphochlamys debaryana]
MTSVLMSRPYALKPTTQRRSSVTVRATSLVSPPPPAFPAPTARPSPASRELVQLSTVDDTTCMAAAEAWGRGMHADPLLTWLTGGSCPDRVSRFFGALAAMLLRARGDRSGSWMLRLRETEQAAEQEEGSAPSPSPSGPIAAVCIGFEYPRAYPSDWQMLMAGLLGVVAAAPSLSALPVFLSMVSTFEARKAEFKKAHGPFYYIACFGTVPESQGQGLGSELLQKALQRADQLGIPSYLEANGAASAAFYRRHGFQDLEELAAAPGAPCVVRMARWPRGGAGGQ